METDLVSVHPDSINQIDLDMLGTTLVANCNENFDIPDGLLDQERESSLLSQPGQLPLLSRAPYKEVDDI